MLVREFLLGVRKHDRPLYRMIYNVCKYMLRIEMPCIKPFYSFLYHERLLRRTVIHWIGLKLYYEPMFKSQCVCVGKNFRIVRGNLQGIPYITGNPYIEIGSSVTMHSVITIAGSKVYERPTLRIGDGTYIGSRASFSIAKEISIGRSCLVADDVTIRDNDGHPVDFRKRLNNQPVDLKDVKPILIGDYVWIGSGSVLAKGIKIGEGAIVGSGSVVIKDVAPFTVVAGNPATVVKTL
jgi:acetyltransferase-like isoleucine patch superfamily enzyme